MDTPAPEVPDRQDGQDMLSVVDAATAMGVTPDAVRKRLQRGTLAGTKQDGVWLVHPSAIADRPAQDSRPGQRLGHDIDQDDTSGQRPGQDVAPLVQLVQELHGENMRLTEAATAWQFRAMQAEQRAVLAETKLAQLTAGDKMSDQEAEPETEPGEPPGAPEPGNEGQEPGAAISTAPRGWRERLAAWLRGSD